ncbi:MAG: MBL fold metallo-hydrolase [Chloroflexi bacterium]|nr:MBL fold metallo-hydrolase [Chloroflexota bacterium]
MKLTVHGSRGSLASAGPGTVGYGGNTACVLVEADDAVVVLDAGSGARAAGAAVPIDVPEVHVLLTHLHMDHIQGLGFFAPLFDERRIVHIWGPPSATESLRTRLTRYLSPPLFPVRIRDLGARVELHDAPTDPWRIGDLQVRAAQTIHPGPTLGYRLASSSGASIAYLPDHEPFLGGMDAGPAWISGHDLAAGLDVLIHDAQYTSDEYDARIGWGHSSVEHAVAFADLASASLLTLFHHDPTHDDEVIDRLVSDAAAARRVGDALGAREGMVLEV